MSWPEKTSPTLDASEKRTLGEGIFRKCDGCSATVPSADLAQNFEVCPACGHHHVLGMAGWLKLLLDEGELVHWDADLTPTDPLEFSEGKPYAERLVAAAKRGRTNESIVTGRAKVEGHPVAFGCFNFQFMGGSMGSVCGEKIARMFEKAREQKLPAILLSASGGARMQEGILSLMQMAKAVSALERYRDAGQPFFSVLLHPTTGGVAASFAFLGDVNIAEPKALIGFAGPRVIENTLRQSLPRGFQRTEFLVEHGMIDVNVSRLAMRAQIGTLLRHLAPRG